MFWKVAADRIAVCLVEHPDELDLTLLAQPLSCFWDNLLKICLETLIFAILFGANSCADFF